MRFSGVAVLTIAVNFGLVGICHSASIESERHTYIRQYSEEEEAAKNYLENFLESNYSSSANILAKARWDYVTNVTEETLKESLVAADVFVALQSSVQKHLIANFPNYTNYEDPYTKRQVTYLRTLGPGSMSEEDVSKMNRLRGEMETAYSTATVCEYKLSPCTPITLDVIEQKLLTSGDYDELEHYFTGWHDEISKRITADTYETFVQYQNQLAKANNFSDMGEMWLAPYNDGSENWTANRFKDDILSKWKELEDIYKILHEYVAIKLKVTDFGDRIGSSEFLPAHIFGNMWAQDWSGLDNKTKPYDVAPLDATDAMMAANYTVDKMFRESEKFFVSLGLEPMTETFWNKSMLERPGDRDVVCHASAHDFSDGDDFRIKMCTQINMKNFITAHHEMGHIQYYQQYKDQPYAFRSGANPGFHEAIGDALALSVTTPYHFQCVLELDLGMAHLCSGASPSPTSKQSTTDSLPESTTETSPTTDDITSPITDGGTSLITDGGTTPQVETSTTTTEIPSTTPESETSTNDSPEPEISTTPESTTFDPSSDSPGPDSLDDDPNADNTISATSEANVPDSDHVDINFLYLMQLQKYAFLPFGITMDAWRWKVFDGTITKKDYNIQWWEMRKQFQGIVPPTKRNDSAFDPAAKFHIASNVPYVRDMMKLGSSEPWPEALKKITGKETLDISSIRKFYAPVIEEMKDYIEKNRNSGKEKGSNTAAIIVGIILGLAVVVIVIGYLIGKKITK